MKFFKKTIADTRDVKAVRVLSTDEVKVVAGGINPQPLPPGRRIAM